MHCASARRTSEEDRREARDVQLQECRSYVLAVKIDEVTNVNVPDNPKARGMLTSSSCHVVS